MTLHIGAYTPICRTTFAPLRIRDAHESGVQSPVDAPSDPPGDATLRPGAGGARPAGAPALDAARKRDRPEDRPGEQPDAWTPKTSGRFGLTALGGIRHSNT